MLSLSRTPRCLPRTGLLPRHHSASAWRQPVSPGGNVAGGRATPRGVHVLSNPFSKQKIQRQTEAVLAWGEAVCLLWPSPASQAPRGHWPSHGDIP